MNIPALGRICKEARDYKAEYRDYHGKPSQIKRRAERNAARRKLGLTPGDPREADHKNPISNGGSNSTRNLRAVSQETNRRKGASVGKDWEEDKHPRADNGQFGSGGGKPSQGAKRRRATQARRAEGAAQTTLGGGKAIQSLLSGGSALDKVGWFKQPEKPPAPAQEKPKAEERPKEPKTSHIDEWGPDGGFDPSSKSKEVLNIYDGEAHYKPEFGTIRGKAFQGMMAAGFQYRDGEFVARADDTKAQEKLKYYRPAHIISQKPSAPGDKNIDHTGW